MKKNGIIKISLKEIKLILNFNLRRKVVCKTAEDLNEIEILQKTNEVTIDNYQINKCILPLK